MMRNEGTNPNNKKHLKQSSAHKHKYSRMCSYNKEVLIGSKNSSHSSRKDSLISQKSRSRKKCKLRRPNDNYHETANKPVESFLAENSSVPND